MLHTDIYVKGKTKMTSYPFPTLLNSISCRVAGEFLPWCNITQLKTSKTHEIVNTLRKVWKQIHVQHRELIIIFLFLVAGRP